MTPEAQPVGQRADKSSRWVWLELWGKDAAFAVRSLCRARGFTLTVLATLTLGIGVATIAINLTAWILFRAQPYPHSEQLFMLGYKDKQSPFTPIRTGLHFQAYQEQTSVFSEYAAVKRDLANVVVADEPGIANVLSVSVECLRVLGIKPVLGRAFLPEEHRSGPDNVVVISNLFWREKFQTAADVLGRKVLVDQQVCTVIGVFKASQPFPAGFEGEIYRPLVLSPDATQPFDQVLMVIGRLAPGISREQAAAALATVKLTGLPSWAEAFFADQQPVLNELTYLARPETFWVIFVAAAMLYAIACLNAMNLMLVRLLNRRRELSIRLALGGTRWQLIRLLLIESVGLAITASLAVVLAARWLFPPLFELINGNAAARYQDFWNMFNLGCIGGLGLLACVTVVVVPAWRMSKADINTNLKEGGTAQGTSRRMARLRSGLVILQAAFAVILLAGTGLMVRSFDKLHQVDLGFKPSGIVKVRIAFPRGYDLAPEARLQLFERLQERLATVPGVRGVSYGQDTLLEGGFWGTAQLLMPDGTYRPVAGSFVAANFLKTAGLTLKKGRWLSGRRGDFEVVINESFAKARFGDEDPIGKTFRLLVSGDYGNPIVGVVADVKETVRSVAGMRMYAPNWAYPPNISSLLLRLDQDPPKEFAGVVRRAIYETDPRLIVSTVNSINVEVGNSMWSERYAFMILKGLSLIALGLAVVGLFSVIAFTVDSRRQEFGVRLALGATPGNLHRLVMRRGVATAAIGIVVGVAGALGLTRFMQSLLFETTPNDPLVYAGVAVVMLIAAVLACWLPARRASAVDPIIALRSE